MAGLCGSEASAACAGRPADILLKPWSTAAAHIDAVPVVAVQHKAGNRQRLALGACLLYPVVAASGTVAAVGDFRDDALKPDFAGVLINFRAVDFKAFAELEVCFGDECFKQRA